MDDRKPLIRNWERPHSRVDRSRLLGQLARMTRLDEALNIGPDAWPIVVDRGPTKGFLLTRMILVMDQIEDS